MIRQSPISRNLVYLSANTVRSPKSSISVRPQTASVYLPRPLSSTTTAKDKGKISLMSPQMRSNQTISVSVLGPDDDENTAEEDRNTKINSREPPKGLLLKQRKLFSAAKTGNYNIIKTSGFNYYEADVNIADDKGNTPLFYAARNGNKEICEFLVRHKANVNESCAGGNTPLHLAFASNQVMVNFQL